MNGARGLLGPLAMTLALVAVVVAVVSVHDDTRADDNVLRPWDVVQLPGRGAPAAGFNTQITIAAQSTAGYLPVEIRFFAPNALPADRRLVFRFDLSGSALVPPRNGMLVEVPITVAQGTKTASFTRYLPKWSAGQSLALTVWEEGQALEGYEAIFDRRPRGGRFGYTELLQDEHNVNWLYVHWEDSPTPSLMAELKGLLSAALRGPEGAPITQEMARSTWSQLRSGPNLLLLSAKDVPRDWRGYQRYDVAVLDDRSLQRIKADDGQLQALRQWVLNGGTVVVYNCESFESAFATLRFGQSSDLRSTSSASALSPRLLGQVERDAATLQQDIQGLRNYISEFPSRKKDDPNAPADITQIEQDSRYGGSIEMATLRLAHMEEQYEQIRFSREDVLRRWPKEFSSSSVGGGRVIVLPRNDRYSVPPLLHWKVVARSINYRASPTVRRGVDPLIGSRRYTNWLIPGVAQPPVYTFMGLLTGFVILVGPVAYFRTARVGRSYLMFAIAPLLAIITTVAMFAYGILSDGFGTKVRARQLTWVDGASGDAGEFVRTTYFAGVRPGDGLRFGGNAEVIGFPEPSGDSLQVVNELPGAILGRVTVLEDSQVLDATFLPSRQQRQFVSHLPRTNLGYLQLHRDPRRIDAPKVHNGFGFTIHEAVVRDDDGVYWRVENLKAGDDRQCDVLTVKDYPKVLGRIYNDHRPITAIRRSGQANTRYGSRIFDVIADANRRNDSRVNILNGVFEQWLENHLQTLGEIPRGQFVATADVSQDVLAVEGSQLVASIRYLFGTLR